MPLRSALLSLSLPPFTSVSLSASRSQSLQPESPSPTALPPSPPTPSLGLSVAMAEHGSCLMAIEGQRRRGKEDRDDANGGKREWEFVRTGLARACLFAPFPAKPKPSTPCRLVPSQAERAVHQRPCSSRPIRTHQLSRIRQKLLKSSGCNSLQVVLSQAINLRVCLRVQRFLHTVHLSVQRLSFRAQRLLTLCKSSSFLSRSSVVPMPRTISSSIFTRMATQLWACRLDDWTPQQATAFDAPFRTISVPLQDRNHKRTAHNTRGRSAFMTEDFIT